MKRMETSNCEQVVGGDNSILATGLLLAGSFAVYKSLMYVCPTKPYREPTLEELISLDAQGYQEGSKPRKIIRYEKGSSYLAGYLSGAASVTPV